MTDSVPFVAKVIGQGKITIPFHARAIHGLRDGDYVQLILVEKLNGTDEDRVKDGSREPPSSGPEEVVSDAEPLADVQPA